MAVQDRAETAAAADRMVVIAHLVSRVEAWVLVSALEAAGIIARADGVHHASASVNSLVLGGHRIFVPASQYAEASALIRESGLEGNWEFSRGLQRAVLRVIGVWYCLNAPFHLLGVAFGGITVFQSLALLLLQPLGFPVNPQGRGDYYLAVAEG